MERWGGQIGLASADQRTKRGQSVVREKAGVREGWEGPRWGRQGVMWLELLTRRVELQLSDCPEADMGDVFWEPGRSLNIVLSI